MNEIWRQRSQSYNRMLAKYFRYVFNDNMVLAILFLIGGLGYGYSNWLNEVKTEQWWFKPLIIVGSLIGIAIPKIISFFKTADQVFLIHTETDLLKYLKRAYLRSLVPTLGLIGVIELLLLPIMAMTLRRVDWIIGYYLVVGFFGMIRLLFDFHRLDLNRRATPKLGIIVVLGTVLAITIYWPVLIWLVTVVTLIILASLLIMELRRGNYFFDWRSAIELEKIRINNLYSFFNLFTTVPQVSSKPRRRRILSGILQKMTNKSSDAMSFLLSHLTLRNANISGIVSRLFLVALVLSYALKNMFLQSAITGLITYLALIQITPIIERVTVGIARVYSFDFEELVQALRNIQILVAIVFTIGICLASELGGISFEKLLLVCATQLIASFVAIKINLPKYFKKTGVN